MSLELKQCEKITTSSNIPNEIEYRLEVFFFHLGDSESAAHERDKRAYDVSRSLYMSKQTNITKKFALLIKMALFVECSTHLISNDHVYDRRDIYIVSIRNVHRISTFFFNHFHYLVLPIVLCRVTNVMFHFFCSR